MLPDLINKCSSRFVAVAAVWIIYTIHPITLGMAAPNSALTLAVVSEDPSRSTEPGALEQLESAVQEGLMKKKGVSVITRRHLEKILSEQGLAYQNIVNDRARLGNLCGATVLIIVSVEKNDILRSENNVSAYGLTEHQVHFSSRARVSLSAVDVSTGKILSNRDYSKQSEDTSRALEACASQIRSDIDSIILQDATPIDQGERHKLVIKPTKNGQEVFGLDLLVDGNFVGNTPITTDAEDGVHSISLQKGSLVIWNNRVQVHHDVWLNPDLSN